MLNKLIAIAAIVMVPSLASAQATGSVQQFNGALSDTTDTSRRDTTRSDTSMMNRSDTSRMHRADTSMMNRPDTSMNRTDTTDTSMKRDTARSRLHPESTATDTGTTTEESHGALSTPNRSGMRGRRSSNMGLSTDQVKQLQQAINNAGCHAGPVDGMLGRETREGIACVRQEKGVQGDRMNDVLSALGLGFTATPNERVHAPRSGNKMNHGDSTKVNRGDTTTTPSSYTSDTTTTPTMDTTRSMDSSMASDTTRSMDTTRAADTTMSHDTSSVAPPSTTNPTDSSMNPMNPMHPTDTTLNHPDTSSIRHDTSGVRR